MRDPSDGDRLAHEDPETRTYRHRPWHRDILYDATGRPWREDTLCRWLLKSTSLWGCSTNVLVSQDKQRGNSFIEVVLDKVLIEPKNHVKERHHAGGESR